MAVLVKHASLNIPPALQAPPESQWITVHRLGEYHSMTSIMYQLHQSSSTLPCPPHEVPDSTWCLKSMEVRGHFLALDQAPAITGTIFILDLARHLFIRQKPRFILFIMPSLGPRTRQRPWTAERDDRGGAFLVRASALQVNVPQWRFGFAYVSRWQKNRRIRMSALSREGQQGGCPPRQGLGSAG